MNAFQTKLMRRAWWRFFALALVGGPIASTVVSFSLSLIVAVDVARLLGSAALLLVVYYSFRESLVALYQELDAARTDHAPIE